MFKELVEKNSNDEAPTQGKVARIQKRSQDLEEMRKHMEGMNNQLVMVFNNLNEN